MNAGLQIVHLDIWVTEPRAGPYAQARVRLPGGLTTQMGNYTLSWGRKRITNSTVSINDDNVPRLLPAVINSQVLNTERVALKEYNPDAAGLAPTA